MTGPEELARNFPVPMRVRNPGMIDSLSSRLASNASRFAARTVRFPSSRS